MTHCTLGWDRTIQTFENIQWVSSGEEGKDTIFPHFVVAPTCRWLALTCIAHSLNVFIKDYSKEKKTPGVAALTKQVSCGEKTRFEC